MTHTKESPEYPAWFKTVLTGQFVDSAVSGIRWETATRTGTTDANGTFQYLAGETVRFFLGQLLLGEATGNDRVSLFDIVPGAVAPTTEAEIRALLVARLKDGIAFEIEPPSVDGPDNQLTPFARVLLIAWVLQSLDDDGNPDNGIAIPAGVAALFVADSIDLDSSVFGRPDRGPRQQLLALFARAKADGLVGPTRQPRQLHEVLRHLYASLTLDFVPRVVTKVTVVADPDRPYPPDQNSVTTNLYDDFGRRTERTVVSANGTSVTKNFFDPNGNLERVTLDTDNDGELEFVRLYEYDDLGRQTYQGTDQGDDGSFEQYSRVIFNEDGTIHSEEMLGGFGGGIPSAGLDTPVALEVSVPVIRTYTYDGDRNRILEEVNSDGIEGTDSSTEYQWQDGNMVRESEDWDNDGNFDNITTRTFENGRQTSQIQEWDVDDNQESGIELRLFRTSTFENGKLTQFLAEEDSDGDGPEARAEIERQLFQYEGDQLKMRSYFSSGNELPNYTITYEYDVNGRPARATHRYPSGDLLAPRVTTWTYDDNGVFREEQTGEDANDDGTIDAVSFLRQRDENGRPVLKWEDRNADGIKERIQESFYNPDGNLDREEYAEDDCCTDTGEFYGDGTPDQTRIKTYEYGDAPAWWSVLDLDYDFGAPLLGDAD